MDRKYLEKHGNQWRVQVKVPLKARPVLGKARLVVALGTDSLANANRLKHRIVADLKDKIGRAEAEAGQRAKRGHDPLVEEALQWRAQIEAEQEVEDLRDEPSPVIPLVLEDRAEEIERSEGTGRASMFFKVAQGLATPVPSFIDAWLAERLNMKPRQKLDYRRAVKNFAHWLTTVGLDGSMEATTRKIGGRYVSEAMVAKNKNPGTVNKDISVLSGYWKWLIKKGHVTENIWSGQALPRNRPRAEEKKPKRPFTDAEVAVLLRQIEDELVLDAARIAALSGMRLEEIARLRVKDTREGIFTIREAKTAAGIREVPIHPDLSALVARRSALKRDAVYLFDELKDPPSGSAMERGQPITKRFVLWRRRLGVDERLEGSRQSRIDFHSFRRWFIRKASESIHHGARGFDQWTIADVVGHDREASGAGLAMTMGRYAGAASIEARRACVEAVRLPP